jgi:hypothetical protein
MTLRLICPDETAPIPRAVWLELMCDGCSADLFGVSETFRQDGYIAQRHAATRAGWKFAGDGKIYGPCCRGTRRSA